MKQIKRYTKEQALEIINKDKALKKDLKDLKPYNDKCEVNHSFECGNFFNLCDMRTEEVYKDKIVIQWLDSGYTNEDDELDFEKHMHEVIADSLEEAVVLLRDIEEANGDIE